VDLLVALGFGFLDEAGFNSTAFVLQNAIPNAIIDRRRARTDVELETLAFLENKGINSPCLVRKGSGKRQEPVDAWCCGVLEDVEKAFTERQAYFGQQGSEMLKRGGNRTKARVDPVRDADAQPGEMEHERLDVRSVESHLDDYAQCEVGDQSCKDPKREAGGFVDPTSILKAVAMAE